MPGRPQPLSEIALIVGAPLMLAVVELFHPQPHDLLDLDVETWLVVHYAQVVLFPLSALAVVGLIRGRAGLAAGVCRVSMFLFAVSYTAFDTAAGIVTGILVNAAHKAGNEDAWRAPIDAVWTHPIMGGSPLIPAPFLAVLGTVALSVGAVAAGIALKRAGSSWGPVVLIAISGFGLSAFRTHAWPGGPLTFGGLAVAAAWVLWERNRQAKDRIDHAAQQRIGAGAH
jgi:hypothetical protein